MELVECPECGGYFGVAGPDNVFIHLIALHSSSRLAQAIMAEIADLDLPEPVR